MGYILNLLPHRDTFTAFANRADPDQGTAWSVSTLFAYGNMIYGGPDK